MKILGTLCTLALFLLLIAPTPGYSQDRDENKPNKPQDEQKPRDKENDKARENGRAKPEDKAARPDDNRRNENSNMGRQEEHQNQPEANRPQEQQQRDQRNDNRDQRNDRREQQRPVDNDHPAVQGNGHDRNRNAGNRGRRIPDDQFRSHFGREHHFHVQRERIVNVSQPVVVYGGYSWQLAEPWPSDWSYDDDCYIDEVDGEYFLFDDLHPGIRIAVFLND